MNEFAKEVRQIVGDNHYCTIVGETGSGKTTQVPQILLDEAIDEGMGSAINIICTQPRRIAATSVAARVAAEREEELGDTVGYHIRYDAQLPVYGGSITYCTTGILLKQLQDADEVLDAFSHIILDEVHERDINLDFTLIMLKRAFIERARIGKPVPKLILMSATIDTTIFQDYFADPRLGSLAAQCPALHVPGRTFPVQRHYLCDIMDTLTNTPENVGLSLLKREEKLNDDGWIALECDMDPTMPPKVNTIAPLSLFATLIAHVVQTTKSGAILVFLPGMGEIMEIMSLLLEERPLGVDFNDATKFNILQLHSLLEQGQRTVFDKSPPGVRKIILSTNIAETSVTIPDVTVVIDSGLMRQMHYNSTFRRSELKTLFASQSNLKQRAGRAGRVQAGDYFALFNEHRLQNLPPSPIPEMRLANLADLSLVIRAQQKPVPIAEFLADAVQPPLVTAMDAAISDLTGLGAITEDESITPLGRVLDRLPLDPALGKLIVLGILFECLDPIIILGMAAGSKPWHRGTRETEREIGIVKEKFSEGTLSEHFALLHAYRDIRTAFKKAPSFNMGAWCREKYLRVAAIQHIEQSGRQVEEILSEAGLVLSGGVSNHNHHKDQTRWFRSAFGPAHLNTNSHNEPLIRAVLAAGIQPNMAWPTEQGGEAIYSTSVNKKIYPSSGFSKMMAHTRKYSRKQIKKLLRIMIFEEMFLNQMTGKTSMSTVTPISPLVAALFGDNLRNPNEADLEVLGPPEPEQGGDRMLVVGRDNPNNDHPLTVPRLALRIGRIGDEQGGSEAKDALLRFRQGMEQTLDRVLGQLIRGRQEVDEDPAWRLYVDALAHLVGTDGWKGLGNRRKDDGESRLEQEDDE